MVAMNFNRKWKLVFFAAALGLLAALASSTHTLADDQNCTGSLGAITVDNLRVPPNAACSLNGTIVEGNIFVESNAGLQAGNVKVDGNIRADHAAVVNVFSGSTVGGSIQIIDSGAVDIQSVKIGGDLQAFQNSGGVFIIGNSIDGNLQCKGNVPPPVGFGNIVQGSMEDQCAGFDESPTPTPTHTPTATSTPPPPTPTSPAATPTAQPATATPPSVTSTPPPTADLEAPSVQWLAPVPAGTRYDVRDGEQIVLEVGAIDNGNIGQVRFLRWDAVNEIYVPLGSLTQPPFRIVVDASTFNPGWNQVFVVATDTAGNSSSYAHIWIYRLAEYRVYLPFTGK